MEGSESEAGFDSLNLNPQLFINETLNTVDDLVNDAFDFYLLILAVSLYVEASKLLIIEDTERFADLTKDELPGSCSMVQKILSDPALDTELDSLRDKLTLVMAETDRLNSEFKELESQSASTEHCAGLINEALQLYEDKSAHGMFQEMMKTAMELGVNMQKVKTRQMEKLELAQAKWTYNSLLDYFSVNKESVLSSQKFDDLQEFVAELKRM